MGVEVQVAERARGALQLRLLYESVMSRGRGAGVTYVSIQCFEITTEAAVDGMTWSSVHLGAVQYSAV